MEYEKRLRPFCRFSIMEIPESRLSDRPSPAQIDAALEKEGKRILSLAEHTRLFALCIEGRMVSSEQLAKTVESAGVGGASSISFAIGSSFGLSNVVKSKADDRLSLSLMTFPHQLARVMLCEQLYRVFQIINHGKYHK